MAKLNFSTVIIGPESPLRFLPTEMTRRQALLFEGIRFSIEMADVAHRRLRETLLRLTDVDAPHEDVARAVEDAWSIIDSSHRLKGILQQAPGIAHREKWPGIRQLLVDIAAPIDKVRNVFQHLNQDVERRLYQNWPLFGILHWFRLNSDGNSGRVCSLMAGTIADGERPLMNVHGKRIYEPPLGMIELQVESTTVSITELMEIVKRIAGDLERSIPSQENRTPCDSLIRVDIQFSTSDI